MKKNFKSYALAWLVLLVLWCAVVFLVRPILPGYVIQYDARFWIAFVFILAAFIGNLVCANLAFKADNLEKMFLNLPLITISWSALIVMLIVGSVLMLIPNFQAWITAVICLIIFAFNAIAVIKASWAAEIVSKVDEKLATKTLFIKNLTVEIESVLSNIKDDALKTECKKVYEAVRYSDPISSEALFEIENKISAKVDELKSAIASENIDNAKEIAEEIVVLVGDRNRKCRSLK